MNCPQCGSTAPVGASQCSVCRASLTDFAPTGVFDAAAVRPHESAVTGFAGPGALTGAGAMTGVGPDTPPPITSGSEGQAGRAPLEAGQAFGPRYHIIRLLGAGGMGAVYQAWDTELGVAVAIKVIRPEAMSDATIAADIERRFKRELLLARQVTHKNVVRIHDIGQIDGIKYITMSYVDGTDLTTAVRAEGRLATPKVLQIARSVASGLAAAHAVGVVHRDLKPANIMLQADGTALIMDFGIARSTGDPAAPAKQGPRPPVSLPRGAARIDATMAGVIVGTVEYMAPEQARGEAVDQRADVYSFGLILYDLLAGRSRVHPDGSITELQARMAAGAAGGQDHCPGRAGGAEPARDALRRTGPGSALPVGGGLSQGTGPPRRERESDTNPARRRHENHGGGRHRRAGAARRQLVVRPDADSANATRSGVGGNR